MREAFCVFVAVTLVHQQGACLFFAEFDDVNDLWKNSKM
jgi:hypothetical protein